MVKKLRCLIVFFLTQILLKTIEPPWLKIDKTKC